MERFRSAFASREKGRAGDSHDVPGNSRDHDKVIAFMGATGSGKSSFIEALTGRNDIIGNSLQSKTEAVQPYRTAINSINFVLVDTPGFNDTDRCGGDILREIATWLSSTYRKGFKLTGIIYLQPINVNRIEGTDLLNFRAFQKLCGKDVFKHVVLCTTFWDLVDEVTGSRREKELCETTDFWGSMIKQGSRVVRNPDYTKSKDILLQLAGKHTVTLDIQKEMVEQHVSFEDTSTAKEINAELASLKIEHDAKIARKEQDKIEVLRKRDEENRSKLGEHLKKQKSTMDLLDAFAKSQALEKERILRARLRDADKEAEQEKRKEEQRLEKIRQNNERLRVQTEELAREQKRKEAEEQKIQDDRTRHFWYKTYRTEFDNQYSALKYAQLKGTIFAHIYGFHRQSPVFLTWCDRCFQLIGFQRFYHCEPCSRYICGPCFARDEQRCHASREHYLAIRDVQRPVSCCRRLANPVIDLRCDRCFQNIEGLHFHCCQCAGDDFDLCLRCAVTNKTCNNSAHWLHPTVVWRITQ